MDCDDAELLTRWRAGDLDAGERLFERYYSPLERFFTNKVSAQVGDLIHETLGKCLRAHERIKNPGKFREYLFTVAYNTLYSHLRSRQRRGETIDVEVDSIAALTPGPSSALAHKREQRLLLEALRHLPVADQVLLELHYWQSLTTAEIGAIVGCPRNTVKSRLHRAHKRLKSACTELAESAALLQSTLSDLDGWAAGCRDAISERPEDND